MPQPLQPLSPNLIDDLVFAALEEDGAFDDVTTRALIRPDQWGHGHIIAKDDGVIAGLPIAAAAMTAIDEQVSFDTLVEDGLRVAPGEELAEVEGPLVAILACERVALNYLQHLSGIASLTREYVAAVAHTKARILDTRKTTPGLRHFEKYAVRAGGGLSHRFNLSSGVLIKDNHIVAARLGGLDDLEAVVTHARNQAPHTLRIEIEVTSVEQLREALEGHPDIILLDNMRPDEIRECVEITAGRALLEASGGVSLQTVRVIAETGVDYVSVGRITHSAPAMDISLEIGAV